jgi:hypothetical protein
MYMQKPILDYFIEILTLFHDGRKPRTCHATCFEEEGTLSVHNGMIYSYVSHLILVDVL